MALRAMQCGAEHVARPGATGRGRPRLAVVNDLLTATYAGAELAGGKEASAVRAFVACIFMLILIVAARGEPDVFMRAVGFALTGSDDADPKVIGDRANCVFAIKSDIFRLNNLQVDRLNIRGWTCKGGGVCVAEHKVTVELHGDDIVFEETKEPLRDDGSDLMKEMRLAMPDAFKSHHNTYKEHELTFYIEDQDRVMRAWAYIYSHGCTGKRSPF